LLVDIHILLPKIIDKKQSLATMVQEAANSKRRDGCPQMVEISDFYSRVGENY
jgi:hypothetical protein